MAYGKQVQLYPQEMRMIWDGLSHLKQTDSVMDLFKKLQAARMDEACKGNIVIFPLDTKL